MERRKQRAGLDLKSSAADLFDAVRDPQTVQRVKRERFQDKQVKRSLQEIHGFGFRRIGILYV